MNEHAVFPDWPAKRDAIRAALATREPRLDLEGPLRVVMDELTTPDGALVRVVARTVFLEIAAAVEPRLLADLAGEPLDQYAAAWEAAGGSPTPDPAASVDLETIEPDSFVALIELMGKCREAVMERDGATRRWCADWNIPFSIDLPDDFPDLLDDTAMRVAASRGWGMWDVANVLSYWRLHRLPADDVLPFGHLFLLADRNLHKDLDLARQLRLPVASWDPQREKRSAAAQRIASELVHAVDAELERIEVEAWRVATTAPHVRPAGLEHLVWLARYQFRCESFNEIARSVHRGRQTVTDGVKSAATLIDLPLRAPNRPGRPRRPG